MLLLAGHVVSPTALGGCLVGKDNTSGGLSRSGC